MGLHFFYAFFFLSEIWGQGKGQDSRDPSPASVHRNTFSVSIRKISLSLLEDCSVDTIFLYYFAHGFLIKMWILNEKSFKQDYCYKTKTKKRHISVQNETVHMTEYKNNNQTERMSTVRGIFLKILLFSVLDIYMGVKIVSSNSSIRQQKPLWP